jgi:hypothetical protein
MAPHQIGNQPDAGAIEVSIGPGRVGPVAILDAMQERGMLRGDLGRRAPRDAVPSPARLDHRHAMTPVLEHARSNDPDDPAADDREIRRGVAF